MMLCSFFIFLQSHAACHGRDPRDCSATSNHPFSSSLPLCGNLNAEADKREILHIFGTIGDFGVASDCEIRVSELIGHVARLHNEAYRHDHSDNSEVDFIFTTGDNAYGSGQPQEIDDALSNIYGKYILHADKCVWPVPSNNNPHANVENTHQFVGNVKARSSSMKYRFFPTLGNHDQLYSLPDFHLAKTYLPYLQYFDYLRTFPPGPHSDMPGMWYTYQISEHLALFSVNSNGMLQEQKTWLKAALQESKATFKIVFFHYNPVGSATHHYPDTAMRWPFSEWGASAVFSGHVHVYERLECCDDGSAPPCSRGHPLPYIVNGLGGADIDGLYTRDGCPDAPGTQVKFVDHHGFVLGVLSTTQGRDPRIDFCLYTMKDHGSQNDTWVLKPKSSTGLEKILQPEKEPLQHTFLSQLHSSSTSPLPKSLPSHSSSGYDNASTRSDFHRDPSHLRTYFNSLVQDRSHTTPMLPQKQRSGNSIIKHHKKARRHERGQSLQPDVEMPST